MSLSTGIFILLSVSLSVAAQILLKHGMSNKLVQISLQEPSIQSVYTVITNISVLGGLFSYVTSAAIWLIVLSRVDVSKAYPFVGLGFIGTMLFAYVFLNEPLTTLKVVGTLLVLAGIVLVSR